jgi:hypothetical protein
MQQQAGGGVPTMPTGLLSFLPDKNKTGPCEAWLSHTLSKQQQKHAESQTTP